MDPITRLNAALEGRYRIESELGEGGMATVYLADDLKHERKVALKVLKPELAAVVGADRFLAEIKTTANLQHPHILPLYDSGEADKLLFYVMPYVEGESLRERLDREHQLPVDDAVRITTNMAEALDYAHRQGVIHRDIKPANVLLQDGKPVISDFGIALAVSTGGGHRLTETGLSLGTPHYMSPEQATGDQNVGPATDIYALGCVLYELLVGEPPFTGSTAQAVLGSIITGDIPSAKAKRSTVPTHVDAAIAKALEKVPADRFRAGADLVRAFSDPGVGRTAPEIVAWSLRPAVLAPIVAVASIAATFAVIGPWTGRSTPEAPAPVLSLFEFDLPGEEVLDLDVSHALGALLFTVADSSGISRIVSRDLTTGESGPIANTDGARYLATSPDGEWISFVIQDRIMKIRPSGGIVVEVLRHGCQVRGLSWRSSETLVFGSHCSGLWEVAAEGGTPVSVTEWSGGKTHGYPWVMPGGGTAFQLGRGSGESEIAFVLDEGGSWSTLGPGARPQYVPTGHLIYERDQGLWAVPVDVGDLVPTGEAVPVLDSVDMAGVGWGRDGVLFIGPNTRRPTRSLVWVDADGNEEPLSIAPGWYEAPLLSPTGDLLLLRHQRATPSTTKFWIHDLMNGGAVTLTEDAANEWAAVWTLDGREVLFTSRRSGPYRMYRTRADGAGTVSEVGEGVSDHTPLGWTPSGGLLVYDVGRDELRTDVQAAGDTITVLDRHHGRAPRLSPSGAMLAYTTEAPDGEWFVEVRPFPKIEDGRWRIPIPGAIEPSWSRSGDRLFFRSGSALMGVDIDAQAEVPLGRPYVLFSGPYHARAGNPGPNMYDIAPDDRFLMLRLSEDHSEEEQQVRVLVGFFEELKRLVPN